MSRHWLRSCVGQVAVLVPAAVEELDEPHAALDQPAGEQAVGGEGAGLAGVGAVQVERALGLASTRSVSSGTLVCIRKAISYCAMRVSISGSPSASWRMRVELAEAVEHVAAGGAGRRRRGW